MINQQSQTQYHLVFATRNPIGMRAMKSAAWTVDPRGTFSFSDRANPLQSEIFVDINDEQFSRDLAERLVDSYIGQTIAKSRIEEEVDWDRRYMQRHLTRALKSLLADGKIQVLGQPGKQVRGFPSDSQIHFS
jgi:hypothetical protein